MGMFRNFFYKKPPDGLLEICERVYVFDYCFTTDVLEEDKYKEYVEGIIIQFRDHFLDASFMVFDFREGDNQSQISSILSEYDMTVMDYPRQYEGCPLLTLEMIHHYLRSSENWLQLGQQNVLLMHCERSGWPVLAFMLAALLIYRKQYTGEQKTLDMIYKQANRELLQLMSPLNPLPSQLRYLQYISRRNVGSKWPPLDRALTLDCIIMRFIPNMDGEGGCRPIFRIYGPDPFMAADRTPKVLFSTPKRSKLVRYCKQADCELVKIDIHCHVQGDVVLECISLGDDLEREQMMFRVMFNTAFIRSNILMLNRDDIDILWNVAKNQFPKDFRVEVLFSDMDASSSVISIDLPRIEDKEGLPVEAFARVQEMFSNVDWLESNAEVANVLQQITASNIFLERLDGGVSAATSSLLKESISGKLKLEPKRLQENYDKFLESTVQGKTSLSSLELSVGTSPKKKIERLESTASSENKTTTPASIGQEKLSVSSDGPLTASDILLENLDTGISAATSCLPKESLSGKLELESKRLPESDAKSLVSSVQGKSSLSSFESSSETSCENKTEPFESNASSENHKTRSASIGQGKQSVRSVGLTASSNFLSDNLDSGVSATRSRLPKESLSGKFEFEQKRLPENNMKNLASKVQGKPSVSSFQSSEETSLEKKIEPLESKTSLENNIKSSASIQEKQCNPSIGLSTASSILPEKSDNGVSVATSSFPNESLSEKFESETKRLPESDDKNLASKVQGKPSISSFQSSIDTSANQKIETIASKASSESNIKSLASTVQGKHSVPSVGIPTDSDSTKTKIESLESKALLEYDTEHLALMDQGKHSTSLIEPAVDANSINKKTEPLKSMALSENKSPASSVQVKQSIPSFQPAIDANSMEKKIESQELQAVLQLPTQSKIISPRVRQASRSAPILCCNSLQGSQVPISRYHNAPSVLGITALLQDHAVMDTKEEVIHAVAESLPSTVPPSVSKVPKSVEPSSTRIPPSSSPELLPSLSFKYLVDAPTAIEKTFEPLTPVTTASPVPPCPPQLHQRTSKSMQSIVLQQHENTPSSTVPPSVSKEPKSVEPSSTRIPPASPPELLPSLSFKYLVDAPAATEKTSKPFTPVTTASPVPPCPPQLHQPTSKLTQCIVLQQPENTMHDRNQKSLVSPPLPPPPPFSGDIKSSFATPPPPPPSPTTTSSMESSFSTPPPPPPVPPPSSSFPGTPPSTVKDSIISPPPPPPPPPQTSTVQTSFSTSSPPPSESVNKSAIMSGPPPPPPPPRHSGITSSPGLASSAPPPPPPPNSASRNSVSGSCTTVPPVPPPPCPSPNGLSKAGTTTLQSHSSAGNGNVPPPVPGPPSGVPFGAKGRGMLRANPKSQSLTRRSNLKPYHWLKLTRAMQGSLWAETQKDASKAPEFDMSELESLFSAVTPNSDHGKGGKSNRRASGPKVDKVQLIELRRAYNCEIMLSKVKVPIPDVMSSVLALDDSALDVDQVENLIKFCPTKEETELLKGYTGDKDNLGKCEQFFLELMKVPRAESKLRVFSFKIQFCSQVSELRRDLNIVNSASEEIRNSVKLKRIMQTILSLGNALNHGTARGSAVGFRLDSLLKLTDTRARNSKMTLMHYLCKVLAEKLPELLDFPKDLVCLEGSTKIQLKYLAEEMQAISKGLEKVVQELTASENDGPVSENFCKILKEFLSDAEAEVRSLAQLYSNVGRNADALASYFGEDPTRVPFEQVVSTLLNFVRMFVRAHEENCKQLELDRKKAEKEAEQEKLKLAAKKEPEQIIRTPIKSGNIK
ncbi:hypothetical protein L6164_015688 [Bauhinia variegata]|uniref:Uncharacterized protein n=1 Tax=Bauhinia variegata TaxID=167791 RepID=A0ACB9NNB5_BAUVA|nr:hypothetical protein L6164_015688 [Bauhinia variegata]